MVNSVSRLSGRSLPSAQLAMLISWFVMAIIHPMGLVSAENLDPPARLSTVTRDGTRLVGQVTACDDTGVTFTSSDGKASQIAWDNLRANIVYNLHQRILAKAREKTDAPAWMVLGDRLRAMPDGWKWSNYAYGRAAQLDPSLKDKVRDLINERPSRQDGEDNSAGRNTNNANTRLPSRERQPSAGSPERKSAGETRGGGAIAGEVPRWPTMTDADHRAALENAKKFAERAYQLVSNSLTASETRYFMFYTDLDADEAARWRSLLDRMYDRMCNMFGVEIGTNIWRGKAAVFVYKNEVDYHKFLDVMFNHQAATSAGMCYSRSDGDVTIVFYRQPRDMEFATVLVHESSHGFLHRYRTPVSVQSWANEGLAEWIAADLVPESLYPKMRRSAAKQMLRQWKHMGPSFFSARNIAGNQYGIAFTFTEFLIQADRVKYVNFINGCKAGLDSVVSLERSYGAPLEEIVAMYGRSMGVEGLTPRP